MFSGEECFLVYLYYLTKGAPFTEMARFVFGGGPRIHFTTKYQVPAWISGFRAA
jgi:hypothetical protein